MRLRDDLKGKLTELGTALFTDGVDVEANLPQIEALLADVDPIFADGFQWSDVPKLLGTLAPELAKLAAKQADMTNDQRREFAADCLTVVYFHYDPDIKYVPNWIESKLERVVVPWLAETAVQAAYNGLKKALD